MHHRLVVHTQIAGGPRLEELLERADAAGQRDERVGAVLHDLLAFPHGVGDDSSSASTSASSRCTSAFGMTPTVRPPRARAPVANAPIAETLPPPDTSVQPRSAIASPTRLASASSSGCRRPRRAVDTDRPLAAELSLLLACAGIRGHRRQRRRVRPGRCAHTLNSGGCPSSGVPRRLDRRPNRSSRRCRRARRRGARRACRRRARRRWPRDASERLGGPSAWVTGTRV